MTDQPTDRLQALHPLVHRLLADNPSAYTYTGTQTYLVGDQRGFAVIDPGPDLPGHVDQILKVIDDAPILAIMPTHTHRDHSPAAAILKEATGAPIIGCAPLALPDEGPRADASFDTDYCPDRILTSGERVEGPNWVLEAVATPGHTSNHLCYALVGTGILFTGDHVMGWSTSVVSPPDGDMADYLASLELLMRREQDSVYYPAHGEPVQNPLRYVRGLAGHRKQREGQILRLLREESRSIQAMVARMYVGIDPRLHGAAGRSVLAHLIDLQNRKLVRQNAEIWQAVA